MPVNASQPRQRRSSPQASCGGVAACIAIACIVTAAALLAPDSALAQGRNPFDVGVSEGGGAPGNSLTAWIMAQQIAFERMLSGAVRAIKSDIWALWTLVGICFAYGVFHAAGPGHGKAVLASYMLANERSLRRGVAIAFLAAMLQGAVAITIVGVLALALNAAAQSMRQATHLVELASYAAVAILGLWLVWRKGRAVAAALRPAPQPALAGHLHAAGSQAGPDRTAHVHAVTAGCGHDHRHGPDCGHFHAPDPATLGDNFSWTGAAGTIFAAGLRPCSGAILVLVFALAQGIFLAGVAATLAMAFGVALTTGAIAAMAVFAKGLAARFGDGDSRPRWTPVLELIAATLILVLGVLLLMGALAR